MAQIKLGQILHTNTTGEPLDTTDGKLHVKASDIEDALALIATEGTLDDVKTALTGLASAAATETTLAALLAKLDDPATQTTLAALKALFDNGTAKVALSGRSVEAVTLFNAEAIADTATHTSNIKDLSAYKQISIMAFSSLNQAVTLAVTNHAAAGSTTHTHYWDEASSAFTSISVVIPASPNRWMAVHSHPAFKALLQFGVGAIQMSAAALVSPTTGSLTVVVWGVPN